MSWRLLFFLLQDGFFLRGLRYCSLRPVAKSPENKNPFIDDNFLAKAQNLGVKIWSLEKAHKVLTELLDGNSPTKPAASKNPSLPHLLRAEALSGITYERDPDVDRPDYYYFPQRSYHLLVEDATGEHRTVIAKEYERPRRGDAAEWPILFGGVEGRPAFGSREQAVPPLPKQQQQQQMQAQQRKKAQKAAAKAGNVPLAAKTTNPMLAPPAPPAVGGGLRRSASVNSFNKRLAEVMVNDLRHQGAGNDSTAVGDTSANEVSAIKTHAERAQEQDVDEYVAASGNSQPVTSNIASVTSGAPLSNANGTHNNARACAGVMLDARLAQLNKRQVLVNKIGLSGQQTLQHRMLKEKPVPGKLAAARQRISAVQEGLKNSNPARPNEPAKPGYCENCRVRYDDFKEVSIGFGLSCPDSSLLMVYCEQHIDSRRHRKFALDANNWADLDSLLFDVARPVLPEYRKAPIESDEDEDSDNQSGEEENSERSYEDADEDTRYIRAVDEDEDEEQERSDAEADSDQDKFRTLGTGVDRAECFVCEDKCVCLCRDGLCSHDNSSECDF